MYIMYTDDDTLLRSSDTLTAAFETNNIEITLVGKMLKLDRLILNTKKTKCIFLQKTENRYQHNYSIGMSGRIFVKLTNVQLLRVFIDNHTQ